MTAHLNPDRDRIVYDGRGFSIIDERTPLDALMQIEEPEADPPRLFGLERDCLRYVTGDDPRGCAAIARANGVTRQAVNARVLRILDAVGMASHQPQRRRPKRTSAAANGARSMIDGCSNNGPKSISAEAAE